LSGASLLAAELAHLPDKPAGVDRQARFAQKAQLQNWRVGLVWQVKQFWALNCFTRSEDN